MTSTPPRAFLGFALSAAMLGCGAHERVSEPELTAYPPLLTVEIVPATASLRIGDTARFVAGFRPPATSPASWLWTSSDTAKIRVDSTGLARAVATSVTGTAVCASLRTDAGHKGCATVVVPAR